jgi:hypothetical protein
VPCLVERINENESIPAAHPAFLGRSYGTAVVEIDHPFHEMRLTQ